MAILGQIMPFGTLVASNVLFKIDMIAVLKIQDGRQQSKWRQLY